MVLLFWTLTVPDREKPVPALVMFQEMVLMVMPGATCRERPIVPTSSSPAGGGGEQAARAAAVTAKNRIPTGVWLRIVRMGVLLIIQTNVVVNR